MTGRVPQYLLVACLFFAAGPSCRRDEPSPPAPIQSLFACEGAPALLGHPEHSVATCAEVPHLPGFFRVTLSHPDEGHLGLLVPTDPPGHLVTAKGIDAASDWLHGSGALQDAELGIREVMMMLDGFSALPEQFTLDSQTFDTAGVGASSFTRAPFELVLYTLLPSEGGGAAEPGYAKAVLTAPDRHLTWAITGRVR